MSIEGLDTLKTRIGSLAQTLGRSAQRLGDAAGELRGTTAATLEAAIAGATAAAVAVRLEAQLALAPLLPAVAEDDNGPVLRAATGLDLADGIVALEAELLDTLPDVVTAQLLTADPRALPVLLALLARDDDLQALGGANASASAQLQQLAQGVVSQVANAAAQNPAALSQWLAQPAEGLAQWAAPLPPAAMAVFVGSVDRVRAAARAGAASVFERVRATALELQRGRLARLLPGRERRSISLDREYAGIVPGSLVLLDDAGQRELYRVQAAGSTSRAEFAVQAKSSSVRLAGQGLAGYAHRVRQTAVHARSEALPRARTPIAADVSGDRFSVAADVAGLPPGRRLLIRGTRRSDGQPLVHAATLVSATPAPLAADGGLIVFTPPLPAPLLRTSVVVHANVALASHGETVVQVLGSGDAAQAHQRFALQHAPLTHRAAATESGARAELEVRVGDVAWAARDTLYAAAASERVYTTHTDEQGRFWLQFGDGVNGARLPSAGNNLRARYRKGLGRDGNVRAEALSQAMSRPLGFKGVSNPAPASGGTDAEDSATARRSMPLGTRTLGRVVSLLDHEDFARAYAGIAKAQARLLRLPAVSQGAVVAITIAAAAGVAIDAANPVWVNLLAALNTSGDPHLPRRLLAAQLRLYRVGLKVRVDAAHEAPAVLAAVEAALRAQGAFDARELGQPLHASQVIAAAHAVPGVVAVDLDFLYFAGTPQALRPTLVAAQTRAAGGQTQPAQLLVLDPGPLARLELMP